MSLLLVNTLVIEPEILEKERRQRLKRGLRVDYIGFALVVLGLGGLELILDRGEREAWLESTFILGLAVTVVVSIGFLVWWELARKDPIVNLKLLANRNFAITLLFMTTTGAVLFGTTTLIPQMLQEVFNYDATTAGLALTVGGIATLVAMPVVGTLTGKVDTRFLLMPALLLQAASLWYMSGWNSELTFHQASTARLISAVGLPFLFVPINTAAYVGLKPNQTSDASALLNVARNLGGSIGIGVAQALLIARGQYHQDRIVEGLNPLNPSYVEGVNQLSRSMPGTGESTTTLSALMQQVREQAQVVSYIDVFHGFMIFVLLVTPLAIFLRQGKAKGAAA